jgi:hypothetical protein
MFPDLFTLPSRENPSVEIDQNSGNFQEPSLPTDPEHNAAIGEMDLNKEVDSFPQITDTPCMDKNGNMTWCNPNTSDPTEGLLE